MRVLRIFELVSLFIDRRYLMYRPLMCQRTLCSITVYRVSYIYSIIITNNHFHYKTE